MTSSQVTREIAGHKQLTQSRLNIKTRDSAALEQEPIEAPVSPKARPPLFYTRTQTKRGIADYKQLDYILTTERFRNTKIYEDFKLSDHRPLQTTIIVENWSERDQEQAGSHAKVKQVKLKQNVTSEQVASILNSPNWPHKSFIDIAHTKGLTKV